MKTKALLGIVLLAGLAFVAACTNKEGSSEAPVFITVSMDFQPGFIDVKSFTAADGERLTLVWWKDRETLLQWRNLPRHREAQETGRAKWYEYYKMEVAEVFRASDFAREKSTAAD